MPWPAGAGARLLLLAVPGRCAVRMRRWRVLAADAAEPRVWWIDDVDTEQPREFAMTLRERITALATVHRVFLALSVIFLASAVVLIFRGEWREAIINGALAIASGWYPVRYIIRPYASK